MKTKSLLRLIVVLALCLSVLCVFTACKDDEIYAGSDDFQSYPEYWNNFNDDSGDLYIPNDTNSSSNNSDDETSSEDFTVNFTEDDDQVISGDRDTDKDGTPDDKDTDDDNDGKPDDKDNDDDNDGTPDDEEKPDYGNQGPSVFF